MSHTPVARFSPTHDEAHASIPTDLQDQIALRYV